MTVGAAPQIALLLSPHAVLLLSLNASAASAAFAAAAALEEAMARGEGGAAARAAASGATWRSQIPRAVVLGTGAFSFFMRLASRPRLGRLAGAGVNGSSLRTNHRHCPQALAARGGRLFIAR